MESAVVIFSGYNMRAIIAFLRVAIKYKVPVIIIAASKDDLIFQTSYKNFVAVTREKNELISIKDIPKTITQRFSYTKYIILPSTESLNRFILENREYFEDYNFYIPLVGKELYEKISNKKTFYELTKKNNLDVPEEIFKIDEASLFPIVLKPNYYDYNNPLKPIIFFDYREFKNYANKNYRKSDWTIQQYVDGENFYLLFYFRANGDWIFSGQKNLMQQPQGGSIITAVIYNDDLLEEVAKKYAQMLLNNGFRGLIMVEVRKNCNKFIMIEANPRLWGPSQLFVDEGIPIFEYFLKDVGFDITIEKGVKVNKATHYFWNEGMEKSKNNEVYFKYSRKQFLNDYDYLLSKEIYNREDTKMIFLKGKNYDFN